MEIIPCLSISGNGEAARYEWWHYVNRPHPKFSELKQVKERSPSAEYIAFLINTTGNVDFGGLTLNNVKIYGATEEFMMIQSINVEYGRPISDAEFGYGSNVGLIGNEIATKIFGEPELAINKSISLKGRKIFVCGIIKKQENRWSAVGNTTNRSFSLFSLPAPFIKKKN